jgi:hypothetical protein
MKAVAIRSFSSGMLSGACTLAGTTAVLKRPIIGAAFLLLALTCHSAMLDGTTCRVKVTPGNAAATKDAKEFDDTLSFADGKFTSKAFLAKGFKPSVTRGEEEKNEAEFEIEQSNSAGDVLNWQGEIRGSHVGGKLRWIKKDGTVVAYYFNGTKELPGAAVTNAPAGAATQH